MCLNIMRHNIVAVLAVASFMLHVGSADGFVGGWDVRGTLEQDNRYREIVGLSKLRTTLEFEGSRLFGNFGPVDGLGAAFVLRGTYDAVYDINDNRYGRNAGRSICLEDTSGHIEAGCVPHGRGAFGGNNPEYGIYQGPLGGFGFDLENNPNEGMIILGEPLHGADGGVSFGVPVRPCDIDSRGCLEDYMDASLKDLRFPEFASNRRLDWLREAYVEGSLFFFPPFFDREQELFFRIGRQQVVWGRTDLFRVLDVINPVDFSRNNIYDELEDIRHPMWIANLEYRAGGLGPFADFNWQVIWNFDRFRPNTLGQCGQPNVILDAGCFFRGMRNLWDNGGTVSNFALDPPIFGEPPPGIATDFGPQQAGIRQVDLPAWTLSNTQIGTRFEGVIGPVGFSLNGLLYRSQLPSLHGGSIGPPSINPFSGFLLPGDMIQPVDDLLIGLPGAILDAAGELVGFEGVGSAEPQQTPHLIAFDIRFPRVKLLGASLDFNIPPLKTMHRVEVAMTWGEEFPNSLRPELMSESRVLRYVIGIDRLTFIRFLNPNRTFLFSFQTFGEHILDHELENLVLGPAGIPNWKDNWISTLLVQGFYMGDRLRPTFIAARDWRAGANVMQPFVEFNLTNNFILSTGVNVKFGDATKQFNDCRDCNPYGPFTAYQAAGQGLGESGPVGLQGNEPLGRFRQGPLGTSHKENEVFLTLSYVF